MFNVLTDATVFAGKFHNNYLEELLNFPANSCALANTVNTLLPPAYAVEVMFSSCVCVLCVCVFVCLSVWAITFE